MISRKTAARARSRKRSEIARIDFGINLLERFLVLATRGEVLFNLFIPSDLVATRDVRSQFRQITRRQLIDSLFDFRETHIDSPNFTASWSWHLLLPSCPAHGSARPLGDRNRAA